MQIFFYLQRYFDGKNNGEKELEIFQYLQNTNNSYSDVK